MPPTFPSALLLFTVLLGSASAQKHPAPAAPELPQLGDEISATVLKHPLPKPCDTGEDRHEPCAMLTVQRERITIAWDVATHRITYLSSTTLTTDNDLRMGDVLAIDADLPVTPFPIASIPHRFVSADWCDTAAALSGDALWCALMVPTRPRSGRVIGFVQSLYLNLPNLDAPPIHRVAGHRSLRSRSAARPQ